MCSISQSLNKRDSFCVPFSARHAFLVLCYRDLHMIRKIILRDMIYDTHESMKFDSAA
jgi:hypothetical protein